MRRSLTLIQLFRYQKKNKKKIFFFFLLGLNCRWFSYFSYLILVVWIKPRQKLTPFSEEGLSDWLVGWARDCRRLHLEILNTETGRRLYYENGLCLLLHKPILPDPSEAQQEAQAYPGSLSLLYSFNCSQNKRKSENRGVGYVRKHSYKPSCRSLIESGFS